MKPTDEQLRDPKWWDDNAPKGATHFARFSGGEAEWQKRLPGKVTQFWCDRLKIWEDIGPCSAGKMTLRPTKPAKNPPARICPAGCGCLWRDNGNGTMSLYGPHSVSCDDCEEMTWNELKPVYDDEAAATEWDGEGLPPVGCECEYRSKGGSLNNGPHTDWQRCGVMAVTKFYAIISLSGLGIASNHECSVTLSRSEFRPIRTKAQRDRDELVSLIVDYTISEIHPNRLADAILSRYNLEPKDA